MQPRRVVVLAAALLSLCFASPCDSRASTPPASFGSPPSSEVPILFNDHHVYTKPDILRRSRVLAALVRNGIVLVPLHSMIEQMGADVRYDNGTQTVVATKQGTTIKLRVGASRVEINGESRPLDVPPMWYKGVLLVPVRVLSEALGAYVQWLPNQRVVVIRYVAPPAPTAPPATPPPATPAPTPTPTLAPTPTPKPVVHHRAGFLAAGLTHGKVYNEFAAGTADLIHGEYELLASNVAAGAYLFDSFALKIDFRQDEYCTANMDPCDGSQLTVFSTLDGGAATTTQFRGVQSTLDGRVEYLIAEPRIYVGLSYIRTSDNYGYPHLFGVGLGIEKLPDFTTAYGPFASIYYYPNATGTYVVPSGSNAGRSLRQQYAILKYDVGVTRSLGRTPVYLYGGFSGDRYTAKQNSPISQTHSGPYLGLGVRI